MKKQTKYALAIISLLSLSVSAVSDIMLQPALSQNTDSMLEDVVVDSETSTEPKNEVKIGNIHLNMDEINKPPESVESAENNQTEKIDSQVKVIENNGTVMTVKEGEYHVNERIEDGKKRTEMGIVRGNIITIQSGQEARAVSNVGSIK